MKKQECITLVREAIKAKKTAGLAFMGLAPKSQDRLTKRGIKTKGSQELRSLFAKEGAFVIFLLDGANGEWYWCVWSYMTHPRYPGMLKPDKWEGFVLHDELSKGE